MIILAADLSTSTASVALLRDGAVLAERTWSEDSRRKQLLFQLIPEIAESSGVSLKAIDMFAAGTGPGSFSGLRISISGLCGMAAPRNRPVYGITSGEAIAYEVLRETDAESVTVAGDARRGFFWVAEFERRKGFQSDSPNYLLVAYSDIRRHINPGTIVATPEWTRIGPMLSPLLPEGCSVEHTDRVPSARAIGMIAMCKVGAESPHSVPAPVYLHPPV